VTTTGRMLGVEMFAWIAGGAVLLCAGLALAAYRRDRSGLVLLVLLPIAAAIFTFGVVRFDEVVVGNEDCVGSCVSSASYNLAWAAALGGGAALVVLVLLAAIRAVVLAATNEERPARIGLVLGREQFVPLSMQSGTFALRQGGPGSQRPCR
jgi:hypothetical protein